MPKLIPHIPDGDWVALRRGLNKLASVKLGPGASPTYAELTLNGLTASTLIGANASKLLESVTIGTSLDYTRPTLNTIQDIRTTASPTWLGLTLSDLTQGSVVFAGASGVISQDNSNFFWDNTNKRLEIGTGNRVMLAPLGITGDATTIEDRHEGIWIRAKTASYIVQINVRGSRLEIGGGVALDTDPAMSVDYLTGNLTVAGDIELGHDSDTTITRASAGDLNIESNIIYRAGGTDVPIADGGTGQGTAQAAIDALSAVSGATNEHVLTKDTATGNAIFKAAAGGADEKVKIDAAATAGYIGAANSDGVLRTGTSLSYADGGNFVTLNTVQDIQTSATPTFAGLIVADGGTIGQAAGPLLTFDDTNDFLEITGCKVGLGISVPLASMHIVGTAATGAAAPGVEAVLIVDSTDTTYINLRVGTGDNTEGGIQFSDDFNGRGNLSYIHKAGGVDVDFFQFTVLGAARMKLYADGSFLYNLKSGANQGAAGAGTDELWVDTADQSIKLGT